MSQTSEERYVPLRRYTGTFEAWTGTQWAKGVYSLFGRNRRDIKGRLLEGRKAIRKITYTREKHD